MIIIQIKPKIGKYISGKTSKDNIGGKVSNLYKASPKPLPKLLSTNTDGKRPTNVPKK